jgi:hypothetical protein
MADKEKPFTTTESRVFMLHRGACTCKWQGELKMTLEEAKRDRDEHMKIHKREG